MSSLSRLCGFLHDVVSLRQHPFVDAVREVFFVFEVFDLDLFSVDDHYAFDRHMHHLAKVYAPLIVRVSGIWYNLPNK